MNRSIARLVSPTLMVAAAITLSACVQTRFEWGSYEPALYAYYKSPGEKAQYRQSLVLAIAAGTKTNKVAPGLHAELGYLYMEDGDFRAAQASFEREMILFPESRMFLQTIIQRMAPGAAARSPA